MSNRQPAVIHARAQRQGPITEEKQRRIRGLQETANLMRADGYDLKSETISFKLPVGYYRAAHALAEATLQNTGDLLSDMVQVCLVSQLQSNFDSAAFRAMEKDYFIESRKSRKELEAELKELKAWSEPPIISKVELA
ncbi:MAG TPA: hypothetical protein VFE91_04590 [Nitrososphaerales archaeon]|nr:hypothetical protein [Nitrososphaerales archaeon]